MKVIALTLRLLILGMGLLSACAHVHAEQGSTAACYFKFEEQVCGRLASDHLAVKLKPTADSKAIAVLFGGAFLSGDTVGYVRKFEQEGLKFLQSPQFLGKDLFEMAEVLREHDAVELAGVPFFIEESGTPLIVTDEFIVRFKPGVTDAEIRAINQVHQVEVVERNRYVKNQYLLRVSRSSDNNALQLANDYQRSAQVLFAHPNFLVHVEFQHFPTDTNFVEQWHLNNDGTVGIADADIDAVEAWDITRGNPITVVAVYDGGADVDHFDINDNILVNAIEKNGIDDIDDDKNGCIDDIYGCNFIHGENFYKGDLENGGGRTHGQAVAGLVAAEENDEGVVGVCPQCRMLLIADGPRVNDIANAIYYAQARGADIITMSVSIADDIYEQPCIISAVAEVATDGRDGRGIPIFASSGNVISEDEAIDIVDYPARDPNTIAVGAADCFNRRPAYTQYGPELNLLGPSSTDLTPELGDRCGLVTVSIEEDALRIFGGTSGATPIVAGVAGLMLSINPQLTREQIQTILEQTADKIDAENANYDPETGHSETHGFGRVNARAALLELLGNVNAYFPKLTPKDKNVKKTLDTESVCAPGFTGGTYTIRARFENTSRDTTLAGLLFEVKELSDGPILCNADGVAGGEGATLALARVGDYADGLLGPGEHFYQTFEIGLAEVAPFTLFVDLLGAIAKDETAPSLIQSTLGPEDNNLEVVVREADNKLHHYFREKDKDGNFVWLPGSETFAEGATSAPSLIQSTLGPEGDNLEVVVRGPDRKLHHYFREKDKDGNFVWLPGSETFAEGATSAPSLIQSTGPEGEGKNLEVVVRETDNKLHHYFRTKNKDGDFIWLPGSETFADNVTSAPSLIQSTGPEGNNLEVVVRQADNRLHHYIRRKDADGNFVWEPEGEPFADNVTSGPSLIQSNFGPEGNKNLEVVVRESDNKLHHYFRERDKDGNFVWRPGSETFAEGATSAPSLIQSTSSEGENLRVVVREGNKVRHYIRKKDAHGKFVWKLVDDVTQ